VGAPVAEIIVNNPHIGEILASASHRFYDPKSCCNVARVRGSDVLAGVVYEQYVKHVSIIGHSAVFEEHGINRDLLWVAFDYPFNQLMVKRIFGFVPEDNERSYFFARNMGFKVVTRIPGMFANEAAAIVMSLERADCRMLNIKPRTIQSNHVVN
jgi:hypothetical protein